MSVEQRKNSRHWYGVRMVDGVREVMSLPVKVQGTPGSSAFLVSKKKALEAYEKLKDEAARASGPEDTLRAIYRLRNGDRVGRIPLGKLTREWCDLPRRRKISEARITYGTSILRAFVAFIRSNYPRVKDMAGVTPDMARAYMSRVEEKNVSGKTYNEALSLLRGAFDQLRVRAGMLANPFREGLVSKEENTIHREPFTIEELTHLLEVAASCDPEVHDMIVLGACTALRLGDAARLKWSDVNLPASSIRVTTSKTGRKVSLPILPRLRDVLESRRSTDVYVFPGLADLYENKRWELTARLNRVFERAGFRSIDHSASKPDAPSVTLSLPADDNAMRKEVMENISMLKPADVSPRIKKIMRKVYDLYSSGSTIDDISKMLKISKGSASNYLKRIQEVAGYPIVRKDVKRVRDEQAAAASISAEVPVRRDGRGKIQINNRGFHALRATFTTQALARGMPIEMVKAITGHTLVETVLRHYFNPNEQMVMDAMQRAMPLELTRGAETRSPDDLVREIMTLDPRLTGVDQAKLLKLVKKVAA